MAGTIIENYSNRSQIQRRAEQKLKQEPEILSMAVLKFRIYFEEDDSIYRDVAIKHTQTFLQLHQVILKSYEFDSKHQATFYRSNDNWQRGREITFEKYDRNYKVSPLLMNETTI